MTATLCAECGAEADDQARGWRALIGEEDDGSLMVGVFCPSAPRGSSPTKSVHFVLMASRRLNSDRFFTADYTPQVCIQAGMEWIDAKDMGTVLLRH